MVQKTGPNLGMTYGWDLGESGWKPGMDANMKKLDAVVNGTVLNIVNTPTSTSDGVRYLVGSSPSGDFAGQAGKLAVRIEGAWSFYAPSLGWAIYNLADGQTYRFTVSGWLVPPTVFSPQPFLDAYDPGAWTLNNTAWRKVPLATVGLDTAGGWDAGNNTDYVIPQAGLYQLQGVVRPARSGAGAIPDSTAFAAGVGITPQDGDDVAWAVSPNITAALFTLSVDTIRRYNQGDRVALFVKHSATTDVAISRARLRVLRLTD
ncbi:DUF2793 domain-containing protein [Klebsiella pneumoniae]|nr:DUF2793 domain-containing protein [Klebsiella pneumoniae]